MKRRDDPSPAKSPDAVLYRRVGPRSPGVVWMDAPGSDAWEGRSAIDATFPKYLDDSKECLRYHPPTTWVDVDELQVDMLKTGQFMPKVVQRVEGSFTAPSAREFLYLITVTFCCPGDHLYRAFAVFDVPEAGRPLGTPKLRFSDEPAGHSNVDWRFLAVVDNGSAPPHFLVAEVGGGGGLGTLTEIAFNRQFVPSESASNLDGTPVAEHWKVVAELPAPRLDPESCATFYRGDHASDAGALVQVARGACAVP